MVHSPGVYIPEIPGAARVIEGVETSNAAFVGTFARGPINIATRVTSFGAFERIFGGLHMRSETSYEIRSFFLNGGRVAFVVRVTAGSPATACCAVGPDVDLSATSPGAWANTLRVGIAHAATGTNYSILVREYDARLSSVLREEAFSDLSIIAGDPRFVTDVLRDHSDLIHAEQMNVVLPARTRVGGMDANQLDDLRAGTAADFTAMGSKTTGADGIMECDAGWASVVQTALIGSATETPPTGIHALSRIAPHVLNLLCLPAAASFKTAGHGATVSIYQEAYQFCRDRLAFLIVDPPPDVNRGNIQTYLGALGAAAGPNAALYYPRLNGPDPLNPVQPRLTGASGAAAGVIARTDAARGVWKAPAGTEARVVGSTPVDMITNREQGSLNTSGVNAIRTISGRGTVIWGARTLDGADARASEWRYVNVRRLALHIEGSVRQGLTWAVFELNDEPLWSKLRESLDAFMQKLFRQGAFQGDRPDEAYFVKCGRDTTTQADIDVGILNLLIGFAPQRPAEFVIVPVRLRFPDTA